MLGHLIRVLNHQHAIHQSINTILKWLSGLHPLISNQFELSVPTEYSYLLGKCGFSSCADLSSLYHCCWIQQLATNNANSVFVGCAGRNVNFEGGEENAVSLFMIANEPQFNIIWKSCFVYWKQFSHTLHSSLRYS